MKCIIHPSFLIYTCFLLLLESQAVCWSLSQLLIGEGRVKQFLFYRVTEWKQRVKENIIGYSPMFSQLTEKQ